MNFHLAINPASTCEDDFFTGRIELTPEERGAELPACIEVTAAVCTNPGCDCGEICLHLPPLDPDARRMLEEGEPPIPRLIVLITELQEAQAEFIELDEPNLQEVARKLPELLTPEHWEALDSLYMDARTRLAETCDIASYDRIPEWLRSISGRPELRDVETSLRDLFSFPLDFGLIDDTRWFFEEFYPVPNTPSPFWVTVEFRLTADGLDADLTPEEFEDVCDDPDGFHEHSCPMLKLRWNLDTGEVTELSRTKTDLPLERFFDLLMKVRPDANERFRRRHQHLVQSIAKAPAWLEDHPGGAGQNGGEDLDADWPDRISAEAPAPAPDPVRRAAPKVGRNDPCPCGSGKKFKKCCGG